MLTETQRTSRNRKGNRARQASRGQATATWKNSQAFLEFVEYLLVECYPTGRIVLAMNNVLCHKSASAQTLYHYSGIVFWRFGCLLILQSSTWLNGIGNTWKNLLAWINCTTRPRMFLLLLNICWCNRTIQPAFLDCLFLNYYERLLSYEFDFWK